MVDRVVIKCGSVTALTYALQVSTAFQAGSRVVTAVPDLISLHKIKKRGELSENVGHLFPRALQIFPLAFH